MSQLKQKMLINRLRCKHNKKGLSTRIDPRMLKMYAGRPVRLINQNIEVKKSKVNGAMCTFTFLKLEKNQYAEIIAIDGCFMCVMYCDADKVDYSKKLKTKKTAVARFFLCIDTIAIYVCP